MPGTAATLAVGETVGTSYKILGMAGAGGMGVVYRAHDLKLERTVALKFLPTELTASESDKQRFLREARTASSLDHANIGVIHGIEETADGRTFIVMAFYEGQSLADALRPHPLAPYRAVEIAIEIARGLKEAHARQIVHRDIKPSNVMLTSSGSVRIVDFGLAHVMNARTASQTGVTGTYSYMSPEQASEGVTDPRTDIWALGVVLAEMLTGRNPFERATFAATLLAILNEKPAGIETMPPGLQQVIFRMLAKQADARYQSCSELLVDLEDLLPELEDEEALPVAAAPSKALSSKSVAGKSVSGKSVSGKSVSGRAGTSKSRMKRAIKEASRPSYTGGQPEQKPWLWWGVAAVSVLVVGGGVLWYMLHLRSTGLSEDAEKHIAVLPFENIGNNPENAILVDGLMDSLAGRLSNLEVGNQSLWVVPTSEVRRRKVVDPEDALKGVGANLAVKGSVERDGKTVHLNVNLIDTAKLRLIGSAQLEDPGGDLSGLEDQAVARLAKLMKISVAPADLKSSGGSANAVAYEGYLTALGYMQRWDKAGNLDLAIKALQDSVATDSGFALGFAQLGEAFRLKHQLDPDPKLLTEAEANGQKAVTLDGRLPSVYVTLGKIHRALGKRDLASQEFQHALDLDPRNGAALEGLAAVYQDSGRMGDAEAAYQKAAALRPDDWNGYNSLGRFYDQQSKYPQAIAAYQHALQLTPDNAQVLLNLGGAYLEAGDAKMYPQAEQALKKSIELSPTYPAYSNLGVLYMTEQKYADSAAVTEKALQLDDKDYLVWSNLLADYQWLKENAKVEAATKQMLPLVEAAIKTKPQDAEAHAMLASLHALAKNKEEALPEIATALALAPDDPQVLADVADVNELLGDRKQAVEYLQRALQKGLSFDQVRADPDLQAILQDKTIHLGH